MIDTDRSDRVLERSAILDGIDTFSGVRGVAEALARRLLNPVVGPLSRSNRCLDALVDVRRRRVLYYLSERRAESVSIETVARHLTALEVDYAPETLVEAEYAGVRRELRQEHLQRLDDDGVVDFDPRNEVVRFRPSSRLLPVFLRASRLVDRLA